MSANSRCFSLLIALLILACMWTPGLLWQIRPSFHTLPPFLFCIRLFQMSKDVPVPQFLSHSSYMTLVFHKILANVLCQLLIIVQLISMQSSRFVPFSESHPCYFQFLMLLFRVSRSGFQSCLVNNNIELQGPYACVYGDSFIGQYRFHSLENGNLSLPASFLIESDYTGAKFYYQMPFISSSELCSRIQALYRKTLHLNNPFLFNQTITIYYQVQDISPDCRQKKAELTINTKRIQR